MKKYFTLFFVLFLMIGCSEPVNEMILTTDANKNSEGFYEIPADGVSEVKITAKILIDDKKPEDGQSVDFTTTLGTFSRTKTVLSDDVDTVKGEATIILYAEETPGDAKITVKFEDKASKKTFLKEIIIKFGELGLGNKISAKNFSLTCESKNAAYLFDENVVVECFILAQNRKKEIVPIPTITFLSEAGTMETIQDDIGPRYFLILDNKLPLDVEPNEQIGEPSRIDNLGKTRNPRDGLGTIIAMLNGEEDFTDLNSNGVRDNGEMAIDLPEPYVDSNDNAQKDVNEFYWDTNANSQWDYGNGDWDEDTVIWTQTKMLFTGIYDYYEDGAVAGFEIDETGEMVISPEVNLARSLQCGDIEGFTVNFHLIDANLNPIAANEDDVSTIEFKSSGFAIESLVDSFFNLPDSYGMTFDDKGRVLYIEKRVNKMFRLQIRSNADSESKECRELPEGKFYDLTVTLNTYPSRRNDRYNTRLELGNEFNLKGKVIPSNGK